MARNRLAAIGFLLVVGVGSTLVACSGEEAEGAEGPTTSAAEVARTNLRITAEATGQVEPILTVEVKSKASGEVLALHVDTGDPVTQGQLLAEVDPRDVRNGFEQAAADHEVAQSRVRIAEAQLARSQELLDAGVITQQEHEGKDLENANARASLVRAQTNLELARLRLSDVTIRAPANGTIIGRTVEVGQVIQSASGNISGGTTLLTMANLDDMQVRTLVDETDVGQVGAGMEATVQVEAFPDRTFTGTILKIEPQAVVEQNVTMFPVIVTLDNRAGLLKPGMNAEVEVLVAERLGVLTVPNGAVVEARQLAPAAEVLGLDPEAMNLDPRSMFAGNRGGGERGQGGPAGEGASPAGDAAAAPAGQPAGAGAQAGQRRGAGPLADMSEEDRAKVGEVRTQLREGTIDADSATKVLTPILGEEMAGRMAAGGFGRGQRGQGAAGAATSGAVQNPGAGEVTGRRAFVFVVNADGAIEPRPVTLGIGDYDQTEVMNGLEEGEQVALIGAAQLQAQQADFLERIRSRSSGPFGGGGPGGRR